jgi:cadmium resistance protein CadD (predicted permease)
VGHLWNTVATAVGLFAGTNIDDLVVLTVLFLSARATSRPALWQIAAGQYAGIGALVAISAAAAWGLAAIPARWVHLAGLIPLGLGFYGLIKTIRQRSHARGAAAQAAGGSPEVRARRGGRASTAAPAGMLGVALVTIANGADNISVYTPAFHTVGLRDSLVMVAVFGVLTGVWCAAGSWLGSHRRVIAIVERFGHWLVPAVFIAIGTLILLTPD